MKHVKEIPLNKLNTRQFIKDQVQAIRATVGSDIAVNALSGGVDSSVVTLIGHRALGKKLKTYFIDNGIMRKDEPREIVSLFKKMGVPVQLIDAKKAFFNHLN